MWRIIEASISVLLLLSFIFIMSSNQLARNEDNSLLEKLKLNVDEIARDPVKRNTILTDIYAENIIEQHLRDNSLNENFEYKVDICNFNTNSQCGTPPSDKLDVYSVERLISSSLTSYSGKIVKIYSWRD